MKPKIRTRWTVWDFNSCGACDAEIENAPLLDIGDLCSKSDFKDGVSDGRVVRLCVACVRRVVLASTRIPVTKKRDGK